MRALTAGGGALRRYEEALAEANRAYLAEWKAAQRAPAFDEARAGALAAERRRMEKWQAALRAYKAEREAGPEAPEGENGNG